MAHPQTRPIQREPVVARNAGLSLVTDKQRESGDFAIALSRVKGNHYYQGTVPFAEIQHRRKKNRMAKTSRKANR